jgi:heme/copper-type cytochrome/quinol oxidase subunit 1
VAFPRLNALSYWSFLAGGLFLNASWLLGAAPDDGWFGYANLTSTRFSPGLNIDFWVLGIQILGISSILGALNFVVTIINMRAPGMTLMRMPVFVWMVLVTQFLVLLAFPALTVALILLMFDRLFGTLFFSPAAGGDPVLWQHLFWIFGHPEVYILILPAMGIISEVIPTFAGKPLFGAPMVIYAGIVIGFLSFGVWSDHMFAVGLGPVADATFSAVTMLIAIPTGVKILNWLATLWGGRIRFKTPTYAPDLGWNIWNLVSTTGAFLIALSFVVFLVNVVKTTRSAAAAAADPWDGRTLEWSIASPPPPWNFARTFAMSSGCASMATRPGAGARQSRSILSDPSPSTCHVHPAGRSSWPGACSSWWPAPSSASSRS